MKSSHSGDKSAAFTGLILGSIAIFVLMFAVVRITTAHFEARKASGEHGSPAATTNH